MLILDYRFLTICLKGLKEGRFSKQAPPLELRRGDVNFSLGWSLGASRSKCGRSVTCQP